MQPRITDPPAPATEPMFICHSLYAMHCCRYKNATEGRAPSLLWEGSQLGGRTVDKQGLQCSLMQATVRPSPRWDGGSTAEGHRASHADNPGRKVEAGTEPRSDAASAAAQGPREPALILCVCQGEPSGGGRDGRRRSREGHGRRGNAQIEGSEVTQRGPHSRNSRGTLWPQGKGWSGLARQSLQRGRPGMCSRTQTPTGCFTPQGASFPRA